MNFVNHLWNILDKKNSETAIKSLYNLFKSFLVYLLFFYR